MAIRLAFLEKLTPREQKLATALIIVAGAMLLLGLPVGVEAAIASKRSDNQDMRDAIGRIQDARAQVHDRQARKDAIAARYANKAPALAESPSSDSSSRW